MAAFLPLLLAATALAPLKQSGVDQTVDAYVKQIETRWTIAASDDLRYKIRKIHGEPRVFWHFQHADGRMQYRLLLLAPTYMPMVEVASKHPNPTLRAAIPPLLASEPARHDQKPTEKVTILVRLSRDPVPDIRRSALRYMGWDRNVPEFVNAFARALQDRDRFVRAIAAIGLTESTDKRGLPELARFVVADNDHLDRAQRPILHDALQMLRNNGGRSGPYLAQCLKSRDHKLRIRALWALTYAEPADLVELAKPLTHDPDPLIRVQAYGAIGAQRRLSAIPILVEGLGDPDTAVQHKVEDTLRMGSFPTEMFWKEGCEALKKARPSAWLPPTNQMRSSGRP